MRFIIKSIINLLFFNFLILPINFTKSVNQLSFSGGGSFGAVEIGILKKIRESEKNKMYDVYTGISVGGLNAGYLSFFLNIDEGLLNIEKLYTSLKNDNVYKILPITGNSLFNTNPLLNTLTLIINNMNNDSIINTYIGTTNLNSGYLDIYNFKEIKKDEKPLLLMATSAIPVLFPPILFNNNYYVDGGILSNELLNIKKYDSYLNITYITTHEEYLNNNIELNSLKDVTITIFNIVKNNFDNSLATLNQQCITSIGEINMYFVQNKYLQDYSILNFDNGKELLKIGYENMETKKFKIC
jgi:hypothetical protein